MAGRPPIPISKHRERGTFQPCRHEGKLELQPGDVGEHPDWFGAEAKAEWGRVVMDPQYSRVLAPVHRGALVQYCHLYGKMVLEAKGEGKITASENNTLNSLRMQLGLTPASSAKVALPKAQPENKWAKFAK